MPVETIVRPVTVYRHDAVSKTNACNPRKIYFSLISPIWTERNYLFFNYLIYRYIGKASKKTCEIT